MQVRKKRKKAENGNAMLNKYNSTSKINKSKPYKNKKQNGSPESDRSIVDTYDNKNLDPEPTAGLSSASACISLSILHSYGKNVPKSSCASAKDNDNHTTIKSYKNHDSSLEKYPFSFHPVFTHQCFENEEIRGYIPSITAFDKSLQIACRLKNNQHLSSNNEDNHYQPDESYSHYPHHSSFNTFHRQHIQNNNDNRSDVNIEFHRLSIHVLLEPSCTSCQITLYTEKWEETIAHRLLLSKCIQTNKTFHSSSSPTTPTDEEEYSIDGSENDYDDDEEEDEYNDNDEYIDTDDDTSQCVDTDDEYSSNNQSSTAREQSSKRRCSRIRTSSSSKTQRIQTEEIIDKISRALPPILSASIQEGHGTNAQPVKFLSLQNTMSRNTSFSSHTFKNCNYLSKPLGKILKEYKTFIRTNDMERSQFMEIKQQQPIPKEQADFALCLADGKDKHVAEYHDQIQGLALFFIETADRVDLASNGDKGGYWQVLYCFQKHTHSNKSGNRDNKVGYSLAGYITLFSFPSPFRKAGPGTIRRICQVLLLPPYQRAGHGSIMLGAILDNARLDKNVVQINVEDPAPACVALRNCVDFHHLKKDILRLQLEQSKQNCQAKSYIVESWKLNCLDPDKFVMLSDKEAALISAEYKITLQQVHIAYEVWKLYQLEKTLSSIQFNASTSSEDINKNSSENDKSLKRRGELEKKFRLMVKKRLNRVHAEELMTLPSKLEKQERLGHIFDQTLEQYRSLVGSKTN